MYKSSYVTSLFAIVHLPCFCSFSWKILHGPVFCDKKLCSIVTVLKRLVSTEALWIDFPHFIKTVKNKWWHKKKTTSKEVQTTAFSICLPAFPRPLCEVVLCEPATVMCGRCLGIWAFNKPIVPWMLSWSIAGWVWVAEQQKNKAP